MVASRESEHFCQVQLCNLIESRDKSTVFRDSNIPYEGNLHRPYEEAYVGVPWVKVKEARVFAK